MTRTALITGVAGQDGSHLVEFLLDRGYRVHGFDCDPAALSDLGGLLTGHEHRDRVTLHHADVTDPAAVRRLVAESQAGEIYHLAAQTRVDRSFTDPVATGDSIVRGTATVLEAVRHVDPSCRVFHASTSEMFGSSAPPQHEGTRFRPVSPYARAKVRAHRLVAAYRRAYGLHVSAGIMFNHESARRSRDFVTRHITAGVAEIVAGRRTTLALGNLVARRDWGHARDYVRAMWDMLQQPRPADYVLATGESLSVAEFAELAFGCAGLDWRDHVVTDPGRLRPADPGHLRGDASRAHDALGWKPETTVADLVREMLHADLTDAGVDAARPGQASSVDVGVSMSPLP